MNSLIKKFSRIKLGSPPMQNPVLKERNLLTQSLPKIRDEEEEQSSIDEIEVWFTPQELSVIEKENIYGSLTKGKKLQSAKVNELRSRSLWHSAAKRKLFVQDRSSNGLATPSSHNKRVKSIVRGAAQSATRNSLESSKTADKVAPTGETSLNNATPKLAKKHCHQENYSCQMCSAVYRVKSLLSAHRLVHRIENLLKKNRTVKLSEKEQSQKPATLNLQGEGQVPVSVFGSGSVADAPKLPLKRQSSGLSLATGSTNMNRVIPKKYSCAACPATFGVKSLLDAHKKLYHAEIPFKRAPSLSSVVSVDNTAARRGKSLLAAPQNFNRTESQLKRASSVSSLISVSSMASKSSASKESNQCKFCDRKFTLIGTLRTHLLERCEKIPPAKRRKLKLELPKLELVRKAPVTIYEYPEPTEDPASVEENIDD